MFLDFLFFLFWCSLIFFFFCFSPTKSRVVSRRRTYIKSARISWRKDILEIEFLRSSFELTTSHCNGHRQLACRPSHSHLQVHIWFVLYAHAHSVCMHTHIRPHSYSHPSFPSPDLPPTPCPAFMLRPHLHIYPFMWSLISPGTPYPVPIHWRSTIGICAFLGWYSRRINQWRVGYLLRGCSHLGVLRLSAFYFDVLSRSV